MYTFTILNEDRMHCWDLAFVSGKLFYPTHSTSQYRHGAILMIIFSYLFG